MIGALRVARVAAELQFKEVAVSGFLLFGALVQPFFIGVMTMFMLRHRPDFDPVYVVVGAALSGLWSVLLFAGSSAISHERSLGTLELVVAAPASFFVVYGGKIAGTLAFSLVSVLLSYAIGAWLFGYPITVADPVGFAASLVLALVALWSTGMLFAPLGILWRTVGRFLGLMEYPIYSLSGFLFPILLLPGWTLPVSYLLPPYWAALALHASARGELDLVGLAEVWAVLLFTAVVLMLVSSRLFRAVLQRARRAGSLALT
ncbi:MAG TPA: ABC transporter permease [Candidatus Saccharimonadales bacterium]|nr:ABC transporter permease [Candidatus Saccharimonadales bacterium]